MFTDIRDLKPFFKRHQIFTRILAALLLPLSPFVVAGIIVWDERGEVIYEVRHLFELAFYRWEE